MRRESPYVVTAAKLELHSVANLGVDDVWSDNKTSRAVIVDAHEYGYDGGKTPRNEI